jgi:hypothetical protein
MAWHDDVNDYQVLKNERVPMNVGFEFFPTLTSAYGRMTSFGNTIVLYRFDDRAGTPRRNKHS